MKNFPMFVAVLFVLTLIAIRVGAEVNVHNNCDGRVVKNSFDWPVCVAEGR